MRTWEKFWRAAVSIASVLVIVMAILGLMAVVSGSGDVDSGKITLAEWTQWFYGECYFVLGAILGGAWLWTTWPKDGGE